MEASILFLNVPLLQLALKVIQLLGMHPKELLQTIQEVKLLATMDHGNILRYVQAQEDGGKLMILTEFCPNGDIAVTITHIKHMGI